MSRRRLSRRGDRECPAGRPQAAPLPRRPLKAGAEFHCHAGFVPHDEIIGATPEGSTVRSTRNSRYVALRPTLSDFVLKMPRGAQVIYPKDLGPILMLADIGPGAGAWSRASAPGRCRWRMLRAGADIVGYELREDFATGPRRNVRVRSWARRSLDRYRVELRDCYDGHRRDATSTAIVLDLPEPWQVVPHAVAGAAPRAGSSSPTPRRSPRPRLLRAALSATASPWPRPLEVIQRGWHIEGQAVRPNHRDGRPHRVPDPRPPPRRLTPAAGRRQAGANVPRRACCVAPAASAAGVGGVPPRVRGPRSCRGPGCSWACSSPCAWPPCHRAWPGGRARAERSCSPSGPAPGRRRRHRPGASGCSWAAGPRAGSRPRPGGASTPWRGGAGGAARRARHRVAARARRQSGWNSRRRRRVVRSRPADRRPP